MFEDKWVLLPVDKKEAAKLLKEKGFVKSSTLGVNTMSADIEPFIYVKGYAPQLDDNGEPIADAPSVPLDSIENFLLDSRTMVQRNSESALVRDLCELKTEKVLAKDIMHRGSLVHKDVHAYDNTAQLNVRVNDVTSYLSDLLSKDDYNVKLSAVDMEKFIRKTVLNGVVLNNDLELKVYTLNSAAPSQTRKGEAAFYHFATCGKQVSELKVAMQDSHARARAVFRRFSASFKLQVFGKMKEGKRIFKLDKDPKRLDMHASGSKPSNVHQRLFGKMQIIMKFSYEDAVGDMQLFTLLESVKPMEGGVKRRIAIVEDLFLNVEQHAILVKKPEDAKLAIGGMLEKPSLTKGVYKFKKNLTDGGILVSQEVSSFLKREGHFQGDKQSFQARGSNGVKPFAYTVHKLRELSEADMILLGGSRKLDVLPSLLDGTYKLNIVQAARMEEEKPNALVATQALLAMSTPARNLKILNIKSTGHVKAALHDADKAMKLLNIEVPGQKGATLADEIEAQEQEYLGADMNPRERGIKRTLSESPLAIKDFSQKQSLLSIMSKPLEKIRKGHIFMDDTAMKHMGFDLYLVAKAIGDVVRQHVAGVEVPVMVYDKSIPVGKVVVVRFGGRLRSGTALLIRYPILKHEEVQKAEAVVEFGEDAMAAQLYYEEAAALGFYQGLVLFNALDMMSEAMSGADFDGDTCLVTFNKFVVVPFKPRTMILDYYVKDDGEIEGGCPWSDPKEAPCVKEILGAEMPEGLFVEQVLENGKRTWSLAFNEEDVHNRPMAVYYVFNRMAAAHIVQTAKSSTIGMWTNRLMNVEDVLLELEQELELAVSLMKRAAATGNADAFFAAKAKAESLKLEKENYDELANWLVCVVRWAIDEAKHGGAFSSHLSHVIGHLEERPVASSLLSLHQSETFFPTRLFAMTQV